MSVVDTSTWKLFRVGDLFDVYNGKKYVTHQRVAGALPLISNSAVDNGVGDFIADRSDNVWSNFITVAYGSGTGVAFYHASRVFVGETVMALVPKFVLTEPVGIFIAACLTSYGANTYKYERKPRVDEYRNSVAILLPATPDGEPDWVYMESYMHDVMEREEIFAEHLASLTAKAVADGHVVDTSTWKAFKVGDLFDVLLAKGDIQPNLIDDGDVPLVSAGTVDNGIVAMISDKGDGISEVFPAGCLTVSMFGTAFWQTETFYAVSHGRVNVLMPKCRVSDTVGLFLASAVNARFNGEYDYSTMCTRKRLLDATVTLPATSDGAPDWAYMEQYMKDVMAVEALFADELDRVYCA